MPRKALPVMAASVFHLMPYKWLFLAGLLVALPVAASPKRFVSMNLCTDQLLMLLADPDEIVSLSYLARREDVSVMAKQARRFPVNHGQAEEIMRFRPDRVFAGTFSRRATVFMLKRLGYTVDVFPVARNFDHIIDNIRHMAQAVAHPARGEYIITRFKQHLKTLQHPHSNRKLAVMYRENSYTTGRGTLAHAIISQAGFDNLAARLGISGSGHLPLEILLQYPVDVLIQGRRRSPDGSVATAALLHPAYQYYAASRQTIHIDDRLWICGLPAVLSAVEQLSATYKKTETGAPAP